MTRSELALFGAIAGVGFAVSGGAWVASGSRAATSVAVGAGIALLNLWALRGVVRVLVLHAAGTRSSAASGLFLAPKMLGLFGLVWLLLARGTVTAGPLALGYAALPIGVAIFALVCKNGDSSNA